MRHLADPTQWCLLLALSVSAGCATAGEDVNAEAARRQRVPVVERPQLALVQAAALATEPPEDYTLGPGDGLSISIFELERPGETTTLTPAVGARGEVFVPLLGEVRVGGLTVTGLRTELEGKLARFLRTPRADVRVAEHRSKRIAVTGRVVAPGVQVLKRNRTRVLEALAMAGGLLPDASLAAMIVRRGQPTPVDLSALGRTLRPENPSLEPGDVLYVPEAPTFFVSGEVEKPGPYHLTRATTVLDATLMAGGLKAASASPSIAKVHRRAGGGFQTIDLDLERVAARETPDLELREGDVVEIPFGPTRRTANQVVAFLDRSLRISAGFFYNLADLFED